MNFPVFFEGGGADEPEKPFPALELHSSLLYFSEGMERGLYFVLPCFSACPHFDVPLPSFDDHITIMYNLILLFNVSPCAPGMTQHLQS